MRTFANSLRVTLLGLLLLSFAVTAAAETVARCGQGWLELIDGYPVLHLKGTPYEMGYQHGALMKEDVRLLMNHIVDDKLGGEVAEIGPLSMTAVDIVKVIIEMQKGHVPEKYFQELEGLARGSELDIETIRAGNFIPELFHCSGFAVMNSATEDGTLYHGRVLDYAVDWKLQEHPVIIVAEPDGGIPFANVSYAGFIGSVTGMNANHVSIGEMGGRGQGHWNGMPMALLVREVLETSADLDQAIKVFSENPRTCQYYYVIADAKTNRAVGMEASWDRFETVEPGGANDLLPIPVKDCVLLSSGDRYRKLAQRVQNGHGKLTAEGALRLMDRPVSMSANLHNVLFEPASTRFWVANATADRRPAAEQPYQSFQLTELLNRRPDPAAPEIPLVR